MWNCELGPGPPPSLIRGRKGRRVLFGSDGKCDGLVVSPPVFAAPATDWEEEERGGGSFVAHTHTPLSHHIIPLYHPTTLSVCKSRGLPCTVSQTLDVKEKHLIWHCTGNSLECFTFCVLLKNCRFSLYASRKTPSNAFRVEWGGRKIYWRRQKKRFLLRPSLRGGGENQILASGPKNFSFDDDEMPRENSKEVPFSYGF